MTVAFLHSSHMLKTLSLKGDYHLRGKKTELNFNLNYLIIIKKDLQFY
jgi:hypothetical protein